MKFQLNSSNKSENNTLHTFTVRKCLIKRMTYKRRRSNKLTIITGRPKSNRIEQSSVFPE